MRVGGNSQTCYFNPRSPHGERLGVTTTQEMLESISIHAPRTGSDRAAGTKRGTSRQFQSTLPARGATHAQKAVVLTLPISIHAPRTGSDTSHKFLFVQHPISIHAPRTGSDYAAAQGYTVVHISIHAPRTGSDFCKSCRLIINNDFNPRSPHGERPEDDIEDSRLWVFQSTLPARGATERFRRVLQAMSISIHAPRTGSDTKGTIQARLNTIISIHAPRTGSDKASINSRLSDLISIHAPRTGSDADIHVLHPFLIYFNPRSPHGERPFRLYFRGNRLGISIHAPRTGSDWRFAHVVNSDNISIHAPRTGSDSSPRFPAESTAYFNPRSPHGERPADAQQHDHKAWISIHAPRTGSDLNSIRWHGLLALFQSTLPARGATPTRYASPRGYRDFNPRSPHGERHNLLISPSFIANFNPRSPHGERQNDDFLFPPFALISIHAPRTGSD